MDILLEKTGVTWFSMHLPGGEDWLAFHGLELIHCTYSAIKISYEHARDWRLEVLNFLLATNII